VAAVPARAGKDRRACRAALPVAGGCLPDKGWLCGRPEWFSRPRRDKIGMNLKHFIL